MKELNSVMRKKHSPDEIEAKLRQADQMVAQGRRQQDIAKALDISVMTFHRWRKRPPTVTQRAAQTSLSSVILALAAAGFCGLEFTSLAGSRSSGISKFCIRRVDELSAPRD